MITTTSASIRTSDGLRLAAGVRRPTDARGAVVVAHGFSGSQDQVQVVAVTEALAGAGFTVVTFDSRGHGRSAGMCTLGDRERFDVAAAVDLARLQHPQVAVIGASMGAIAALRHAAADPSLRAVITVSCPAAWRVPRTARGLLSVVVTQTAVGRRLAADRLGVRLAAGRVREAPPVDLAARLECPLAVIHGTADRFVRPSDADRLYSAAAGPRRLFLVPGMGHAYEPVVLPTLLTALEWGWQQSAAPRPGAVLGAAKV